MVPTSSLPAETVATCDRTSSTGFATAISPQIVDSFSTPKLTGFAPAATFFKPSESSPEPGQLPW